MSRLTFLSEITDLRWAEKNGRTNLSKYCRQFCPLSERFSGGYSIHEKGRGEERRVLFGSTFRRFGIGTVDRSSVNRSISQADPQGISSFLREQVPLCAQFSSPSFHRGIAFHEKKRMYNNGRREKKCRTFLTQLQSKRSGILFHLDRFKKVGEKNFPDRDDLSLASLSVMISAIIQSSKLKLGEYLAVTRDFLFLNAKILVVKKFKYVGKFATRVKILF